MIRVGASRGADGSGDLCFLVLFGIKVADTVAQLREKAADCPAQVAYRPLEARFPIA